MVSAYESPQFELQVHVRDSQGNPTGKMKTVKTDDAGELDNFLHNNKSSQPRRHKKKRLQSKKTNSPYYLSKITKDIDSLKKLEDGWDSYGGLKPNRFLCATAQSVASFLPESILKIVRVVPLNCGGLQFEMQGESNKEAELVFNSGSTAELTRWGGEISLCNGESEEIKIDDKKVMVKSLSWLLE